jgi:hypothetical protein
MITRFIPMKPNPADLYVSTNDSILDVLIAGDTNSPVLTFPIDAVPVSGKFENGFFIPDSLDGTADVVNPPPDDDPAWERCMLQGYQCSLPLADIADAIWRGDAIVGYDGSAANDNGT